MKMKFALGPRRIPDRAFAWSCLLTNLAMPGSGSLAAGRRVGYAQFALSFGAFVLTLIFGIPFINWAVKNWTHLHDPDQADAFAALGEIWQAARRPLLGLVLYLASMAWAFCTSVLIILESRKSPVPPRL